jgi:MinD-like ATPase involved in chromosome partitioning or flagellar assembly
VTALFSDETFNDFITAIRKTYDYIILDTPALSATPDAGLIADSASMNIIVAKCGVTTTVDIERSISNLIDENHTYFAVLNFVESVTEMLYILPRAMNDRRSQERRKWDRRASEEEARHL